MSTLKDLRTQHGYTQTELAKKSGLSLRTIQRIESSNKAPKGHTLKALAEIFELEPSRLLKQFSFNDSDQQTETINIQLINLSILTFVGIPFGNILFPFLLWRKYRQSTLVDQIGRQIINVQIIWWLIVSVLLSISPYLSHQFFQDAPVLFYILFIAYMINIGIVSRTAVKLQRRDFSILHLPIQLL